MILKAVLSFISFVIVWLIFTQMLNYIMTTVLGLTDTYFPLNIQLFNLVLSFITIFGLVAWAIRVTRDDDRRAYQ